MQTLYDPQAPKKATNLTINSDLLLKAKELKINLSAELEKTLTEILQKKQRELWLRQNQKAIAEYNDFIEDNGVFSDEIRKF